MLFLIMILHVYLVQNPQSAILAPLRILDKNDYKVVVFLDGEQLHLENMMAGEKNFFQRHCLHLYYIKSQHLFRII